MSIKKIFKISQGIKLDFEFEDHFLGICSKLEENLSLFCIEIAEVLLLNLVPNIKQRNQYKLIILDTIMFIIMLTRLVQDKHKVVLININIDKKVINLNV